MSKRILSCSRWSRIIPPSVRKLSASPTERTGWPRRVRSNSPCRRPEFRLRKRILQPSAFCDLSKSRTCIFWLPIGLPSNVVCSSCRRGSSSSMQTSKDPSAPLSASEGQSTSWAKWKTNAALILYSSVAVWASADRASSVAGATMQRRTIPGRQARPHVENAFLNELYPDLCKCEPLIKKTT